MMNFLINLMDWSAEWVFSPWFMVVVCTLLAALTGVVLAVPFVR